MNIKHLTSQFSQDQVQVVANGKQFCPRAFHLYLHLENSKQHSGSFASTFGCSVTTEEYFNLWSQCIEYLLPKRNLIQQIGRAPLQAFATPARTLIVCSKKCNWFTFIIHKCHRYVSFKLTAQSETILLLTSEEEQPEDHSQPPEVGSELFETRPFPETIAGWKLTTKYCLKYNGKTLCRSADL